MNLQFILNNEMRHPVPPRIPRPANAFMIFANENRKQMAKKYPQESNKDISKRLGITWKALDLFEKKKYFELAKTVDAEHKKKYPDYVYNPKEARIRKAMREASREQTLGTAPISSPRGGRRSQSWRTNPEEQLMMTPPPDLGSQMCNNPIFPGHTSNLGQFMPSMDAYTKLVHVLPSNAWLQDSPSYIQHNPMAELQQHQAHMWHQYQEPIRPCGESLYLLDAHQNLYQDSGNNDALTHKQYKSQLNIITNHRKSDEITKITNENSAKQEKVDEIKRDNMQILADSGNIHRNESFLSSCEETIILQNPFDRDDDMKLKKENIVHSENETCLNTENNIISFEGINFKTKTLCSNIPQSITTKSEPINCKHCDSEFSEKSNKVSSYCTLPFFKTVCRNDCNLKILLDNCNSNLIYTDVGVIPMYDSNADVDGLLSEIKNIPVTKFNRKINKK